MPEEGLVLAVKSGWKWYLYTAEVIAIGGFSFLLFNLMQIAGFIDAGTIFLLLFFAGGLIACLYALFYANKHKILFKDDGLERVGVFGSKFIAYDDIEEIWFAPRFWDMGSSTSLLSNSRTLVLDYRYSNMYEAVQMLADSVEKTDSMKVYYDQKLVAPNLERAS